MADNVLITPIKPSEYLANGGYNLVDSGYEWAFGLPTEGQISSAACGAMPFRNGTGLCSPKCLRGEDWVFMSDWCQDRYMLSRGLASVTDVDRYKKPEIEQLTGMYSNLSSLKPLWGTGFQFQNQECSQYGEANILSACLTPIGNLESQPPPTTGDVPLDGSRIQSFFNDMKKFKCTLNTAQARDENDYTVNNDLYWWFKQYDDEPAEIERYISYLITTNGYPVWTGNTRPVQIEALFIGKFRAATSSKTGDNPTINQTKYCLYQLGSKVTLTQDMTGGWKPFRYQVHLGGSSLAGGIANLLGIDLHPSGDIASFTLSPYGVWAIIWPKYLTW